MINRVVLVGRLAKEVDLRVTSSNTSVVQFTLAVNRNFTSANGEKQADFISCVAWRNTADFMKKYVKKGDLLGIDGKLQTRTYEDDKGQTRYVTEVQCDNVQLLDGKRDKQEDRDTQSDDGYNESKSLVDAQDLPF